MKLPYRIATAITSAALVASSVAPAAFADTTAEITNNGSHSTNTIVTNNNCSVNVEQKNKTYVGVNANVPASTGGNQANDNTGGDVTITTGDATASAQIAVGGSTNDAIVPDCCCQCNGQGDGAVISENGTHSTNTVVTNNTSSTNTKQKNKTKVRVNATIKAKTGKNKANNNTGGSVNTSTGTADAALGVTVDPSSNTLNP